MPSTSAIRATLQRISNVTEMIGTNQHDYSLLNFELNILAYQTGFADFVFNFVEQNRHYLAVNPAGLFALYDELKLYIEDNELPAYVRLVKIFDLGREILLTKILINLLHMADTMQFDMFEYDKHIQLCYILQPLMQIEQVTFAYDTPIHAFTDTDNFANLMFVAMEMFEIGLIAQAVQLGARLKDYPDQIFSIRASQAEVAGFIYDAQVLRSLLINEPPSGLLLLEDTKPYSKTNVLSELKRLQPKQFLFMYFNQSVQRSIVGFQGGLLQIRNQASTMQITAIDDYETKHTDEKLEGQIEEKVEQLAKVAVTQKQAPQSTKKQLKKIERQKQQTEHKIEQKSADIMLKEAVENLSADKFNIVMKAHPELKNVVNMVLIDKYNRGWDIFKKRRTDRLLKNFLEFARKIELPLLQTLCLMLDDQVGRHFKYAVVNNCLRADLHEFLQACRVLRVVDVCEKALSLNNTAPTSYINEFKAPPASPAVLAELKLALEATFNRHARQAGLIKFKTSTLDFMLALMEDMPDLKALDLILKERLTGVAAYCEQQGKCISLEVEVNLDKQNFLHVLVSKYSEEQFIKVIELIEKYDSNFIVAGGMFAVDVNGNTPWSLAESKIPNWFSGMSMLNRMIFVHYSYLTSLAYNLEEVLLKTPDVFGNNKMNNTAIIFFKAGNYQALVEIINERCLLRNMLIQLFSQHPNPSKVPTILAAFQVAFGEHDFHTIEINRTSLFDLILADIYFRPENAEKYSLILTAKCFTNSMAAALLSQTYVWNRIEQIIRLSTEEKTKLRLELIKLLAEIRKYIIWGADINLVDFEGKTLLMHAFEMEDMFVVDYLHTKCGAVKATRPDFAVKDSSAKIVTFNDFDRLLDVIARSTDQNSKEVTLNWGAITLKALSSVSMLEDSKQYLHELLFVQNSVGNFMHNLIKTSNDPAKFLSILNHLCSLPNGYLFLEMLVVTNEHGQTPWSSLEFKGNSWLHVRKRLGDILPPIVFGLAELFPDDQRLFAVGTDFFCVAKTTYTVIDCVDDCIKVFNLLNDRTNTIRRSIFEYYKKHMTDSSKTKFTVAYRRVVDYFRSFELLLPVPSKSSLFGAIADFACVSETVRQSVLILQNNIKDKIPLCDLFEWKKLVFDLHEVPSRRIDPAVLANLAPIVAQPDIFGNRAIVIATKMKLIPLLVVLCEQLNVKVDEETAKIAINTAPANFSKAGYEVASYILNRYKIDNHKHGLLQMDVFYEAVITAKCIGKVVWLLTMGFDPTFCNPAGNLLHFAVEAADVQMLDSLVRILKTEQIKTLIAQTNAQGKTPLQLAEDCNSSCLDKIRDLDTNRLASNRFRNAVA